MHRLTRKHRQTHKKVSLSIMAASLLLGTMLWSPHHEALADSQSYGAPLFAGAAQPGDPPAAQGASQRLKPKNAQGVSVQRKTQQGRLPNIVWICLDACRARNLSCYGHERITSPNLDELAAQGVLFEQNFAQSNWTGQSVPSYLTGRYHPVSWLTLYRPTKQMLRKPPPSEKPFPQIARENGYRTAMVYTNANISPDARIAPKFDYVAEAKTYRGLHYAPFHDINAKVFPWLDSIGTTPFFLYIHTMDTHFPHAVPAPFDAWISKEFSSDVIGMHGRLLQGKSGALPRPLNRNEQEHLNGLCDDSILYADYHIGELVWRLKELHLLDNTIVIIMADHGDALGEDGITLEHGAQRNQDEVLRVPLIMLGPGLPEGVRVRTLTENVDIVPTLVDLLKLESNASVDGKSLVPLMWDPDHPPLKEFVYAASSHEYYLPPTVVLRGRQFKYEFSYADGSDLLWKVPDSVKERQAATNPEVRKRMKEVLQREYRPLWNEFMSLPPSCVTLKVGDHWARRLVPKDAVILAKNAEPGQNAGKWAIDNDSLMAAGWRGDVPDVTLTEPVPNGAFRIGFTLYSQNSLRGHPASSLLVKVEDDAEFRVLTSNPEAAKKPGYVLVDAGKVEIRDRTLNLTIRAAAAPYWSVVQEVRLIALEDDPTSEGTNPWGPAPTEEERQREEDLRALGYLE